MGTSFAPIGANIYLALLEKDLKDLIASDPSLSWPKLYKRYIDDILKIALGSLAETLKFIELYHSLVPSIKLTSGSHGNSVHFLDPQFLKGYRFFSSHSLDLSTYEKPMKLYFYIPFYRSLKAWCKEN